MIQRRVFIDALAFRIKNMHNKASPWGPDWVCSACDNSIGALIRLRMRAGKSYCYDCWIKGDVA